jgi:acyl-CoA synthetase (AMP-forming)/AMP-acid ligase II
VANVTAERIDVGDDLPLTVGALLAARATAGDAPLLVTDDEVLTYGDADRRSAELARGLMAIGAHRGTHVALLHPNGADFVVGWLATARIGAVTIPLSTFSTAFELAGLLAGADVEILLSARAYRSHRYPETLVQAAGVLDLNRAPPLLAPTIPSLRHLRFADDPTDEPNDVPGGDPGHFHAGWTMAELLDRGSVIDPAVLAAAEAEVTRADRMVIVHTSGSTSRPKGVIHTHGALIRHLDNLNQLRRYTPDEVLFSNSPFFWIGGFAYALLGTLVAGAQLVCSNSPTASGVLDLLERARPTMTNGFAASVAHLPDDPGFADRDLSSIRRGNLWPILPAEVAPADPELRHSMLGMTEAGSVCLVSDDEGDLPDHQRGSFGRPAPGLEARVVDPDTGAETELGEVGELWLRGPFLMEGYYGHERAETFTPDGWFRSGDLVSVDPDGLFYFRGRHHDLIKTRGANVSPREVEAAIVEVVGLRAHVLGVDSVERGQVVAAALVIPDGRRFGAEEVAALREALAERLSVYKVPRILVPLREAEVPMMSSGKLDRGALQEVLRAR